MIKDAPYYTNLLLSIYSCKVPFTLEVVHTKPKKRLGAYYPKTARIKIFDGWSDVHNCDETARIKIFDGWSDVHNCDETAIHEYAHHLHYTEFGKRKKKQAPHGREYWQIYGQLVWRASHIGAFNDKRLPVISFDSMQENGGLRPSKKRDLIKRTRLIKLVAAFWH